MRLISFMLNGRRGIGAANSDDSIRALLEGDAGFPGSLDDLFSHGDLALGNVEAALAKGRTVDVAEITWLPALSARSNKIVCVGLNYRDHSAESGYALPEHPSLFARFPSSLIGHGAPLVRPPESTQFDYEGELVAVIGKGGRRIAPRDALSHVVAYSIFNDGSIRDFQHRTPQWTTGKNFDGTGAFGPALVTADELPRGAAGMRLQTRLNGQIVQDASTADLVFDIATLVVFISEFTTLLPGDILVTGTPAGVGAARKPPLFMKDGDVCEVEIEGLGVLRNPVIDEVTASR